MNKNIRWRIGNRDEIYSPAIDAKGFLSNRYGMNSNENKISEFPSRSFPIWWKKISGAKSYALIMECYDSVKWVGVPYIHWVAANIKTNELYEDQSLLEHFKWKTTNSKKYHNDMIWQGFNSTNQFINISSTKKEKIKNNTPKELLSQEQNNSCIYLGPLSPLEESGYVLRVIGIDVDASELEYISSFDPIVKEKLDKPFFACDLLQAIGPHIVGSWTIYFKYKNDSETLEKNKYFKDFVK